MITRKNNIEISKRFEKKYKNHLFELEILK